MNRNQLMALSDASAEIHHYGLQKLGAYWHSRVSHHHNKTIRYLVDKGYLKLWVNGTVAHITDAGIDALALENEVRA